MFCKKQKKNMFMFTCGFFFCKKRGKFRTLNTFPFHCFIACTNRKRCKLVIKSQYFVRVRSNLHWIKSFSHYWVSFDPSLVYRPVAWIVGGVLGFLFFLAGLIAVIVFCCCIRGRRRATAGTVIHTPANNMAVVSTNAGSCLSFHIYNTCSQKYINNQALNESFFFSMSRAKFRMFSQVFYDQYITSSANSVCMTSRQSLGTVVAVDVH